MLDYRQFFGGSKEFHGQNLIWNLSVERWDKRSSIFDQAVPRGEQKSSFTSSHFSSRLAFKQACSGKVVIV